MSAWWAPQSSKLLKGLSVFGGFDSRPPPLVLFINIDNIKLKINE